MQAKDQVYKTLDAQEKHVECLKNIYQMLERFFYKCISFIVTADDSIFKNKLKLLLERKKNRRTYYFAAVIVINYEVTIIEITTSSKTLIRYG